MQRKWPINSFKRCTASLLIREVKIKATSHFAATHLKERRARVSGEQQGLGCAAGGSDNGDNQTGRTLQLHIKKLKSSVFYRLGLGCHWSNAEKWMAFWRKCSGFWTGDKWTDGSSACVLVMNDQAGAQETSKLSSLIFISKKQKHITCHKTSGTENHRQAYQRRKFWPVPPCG